MVVAQQTQHHLFVALFAIAVVTKEHDVAIEVGAFEISAGDVVKHQVAVLKMLAGQGALNGLLTIQKPVHRQIAMLFDIDRALDAAQFPQGGVLPLVGEGQLAAGVNDPPDDHGQAILHPRFLTGVEGPIQLQILGQLQQRIAGSIFFGVESLKSLG